MVVLLGSSCGAACAPAIATESVDLPIPLLADAGDACDPEHRPTEDT
jgi:hypothetical protein